jgi:hypothetical protein
MSETPKVHDPDHNWLKSPTPTFTQKSLKKDLQEGRINVLEAQ